MSWVLIPVIIFAVSFLALVFICVKKYPFLGKIPSSAILNADAKEQVIKTRFNRVWTEKAKTISLWWRPISLKFKQYFFVVYKKIQSIESHYKKNIPVSLNQTDKIKKYIWEAGELVNQGNFDDAEKKYIEVITWDHKNIQAYKGLADLYWRKKDYLLAQDTFEHILKLNNHDAENYWQLASVYQAQGKNDEAYSKFIKAFELTPNSPKYIDSLLEVCIILNKKDYAWKLVSKLKGVNPENQKLSDFEERIRSSP